MEANIIINNSEYIDAYKGRTNYYYLYSESNNTPKNTMEIAYSAQSGYGGEVGCGIKIGYNTGESRFIYLQDYDSKSKKYKDKTNIVMSNVLCVMVYIDSSYGYEDDFDEVFQKQLELYVPRSLLNLCEQAILRAIGEDFEKLYDLYELNLPPILVNNIIDAAFK